MLSNFPLTLNTGLFEKAIPAATSWLLADCMEFRGKQDLWIRQRPELLTALRERAIIQSVESSNRIEGVETDAGRLPLILAGRSRPRDRSEEELLGYQRALKSTFSSNTATISRSTLLRLHKLSQAGAHDAGKWKTRNNEIIEISTSGQSRVRFVPLEPKFIPDAIDELCLRYEAMQGKRVAPSLLLIATFVFDVLCIHPFRDGNGRVARLVTAMLLEQSGFVIARFVSLERVIEQTKDSYDVALEASSNGWHDGRNDISPWWNYFLSLIRRAYAELAETVEAAPIAGGKRQIVVAAVEQMAESFALAEVCAVAGGVSEVMVKHVLAELRAQGRLKLSGRGRGARWEKRQTPSQSNSSPRNMLPR